MILAYRLQLTLDGLQTMAHHAIVKLPSHSEEKGRCGYFRELTRVQLPVYFRYLVFFIFSFFAFDRVEANFFIVLLESSHIFSCFGEFTFFHTFTDIPVDKSSLSVHQIELVVKSGPGFSDCSGAH